MCCRVLVFMFTCCWSTALVNHAHILRCPGSAFWVTAACNIVSTWANAVLMSCMDVCIAQHGWPIYWFWRLLSSILCLLQSLLSVIPQQSSQCQQERGISQQQWQSLDQTRERPKLPVGLHWCHSCPFGLCRLGPQSQSWGWCRTDHCYSYSSWPREPLPWSPDPYNNKHIVFSLHLNV